MRRALRPWSWLLAALPTLLAAQGQATILVPMDVADLTRSSVATVIGTVDGLVAVQARDGRIFTLVTLDIEQVLKGRLTAARITLKEDGGQVADQQQVVFGTPSFTPGERVLLFLGMRRDGSLRTNHFALGKFHLDSDAAGSALASQQFGPGTMVVLPPGVEPPGVAIALRDLVAVVEQTDAPGATDAGLAAPLMEPAEATDRSLPRQFYPRFKILGPVPGRFFEADEAVPVPFLIDQRGDSILGLSAARQAVDDGLAAWTNVSSATIVLVDGGLTGELSRLCPGPLKVRFDDPGDDIPAPIMCHGVLAVADFHVASSEFKVVNGTRFARAVCGSLTFAHGWDGCAEWTACNLAEIATHETGHVIGLGHSSEREPEPDDALRDATMYFKAHFDGRCASVRADDIAGVSSIYPTAVPPTITTPDPLPDATLGVPYTELLTVIGGNGNYEFSIERGGFPGLSLSTDGLIFGTPTATGNSFFQIQVIDGKGDTHTRVFSIAVNTPAPTLPATATPSDTPPPTATATEAPTPTHTATATTIALSPTATAIPSPSPTLTPTVAPVPDCAGDCNGSGDVTVDELLTLVNIALGTGGGCSAGDRNHDGMITVDEILAAVRAALQGCGGAG